MDRLIRRFDFVRDGDLRICEARGIAYQPDPKAGRVSYGADYFAKVCAYEDTEIARAVNVGRVAMLARHLPAGAAVLDIGAGSGAFMRAAIAAGFSAKGFEVMPEAVEKLNSAELYADDQSAFDAVTLWDTLEHMEDPELGLNKVRKGAHLFASIPVFDDLHGIRESKHYRPGEHLTYWSAQGFIDWMALWGYRLLEQSAHETEAGRESIGAFAFCRDLPDYRDHIAQYQELHGSKHYGGSATELHLDVVAEVVKARKPRSILDFGCGRSDLVAHFYLDGKRTIARYDPAISLYHDMPEGQFDLVLVMDVMEHIPMASVDKILTQVRARGAVALFTISTKLARAKLPDGRNAHVTILNHGEWTRWIAKYFGAVRALPSKWEHELILLAGV